MLIGPSATLLKLYDIATKVLYSFHKSNVISDFMTKDKDGRSIPSSDGQGRGSRSDVAGGKTVITAAIKLTSCHLVDENLITYSLFTVKANK